MYKNKTRRQAKYGLMSYLGPATKPFEIVSIDTIGGFGVDRYNSTEHSITGFAPRYLLDGTDVSLIPNELKLEKKVDDWISDRKIALERTIKSHEYNKMLIDKKEQTIILKWGIWYMLKMVTS